VLHPAASRRSSGAIATTLPSGLIAGLPTFMLRPAASERLDRPMPAQVSTLAANL
jgi:hypothetical protein